MHHYILRPMVKDRAMYSRAKIEIPRPNFVVFYNGMEKRPKKEIQKLSDLYKHDENINLELICTVYNINPGCNEDIKKKSEVLSGYTLFVEKVREYLAAEDVDAVSNAVDYCVENGILADFFYSRKAEVIKNMTIDMTFERQLELTAIEYKNQGMEYGEQIKFINLVIKKVNKNKAINVIADELEEDVEMVRPIYDAIVANSGKSAEEIYDIIHRE